MLTNYFAVQPAVSLGGSNAYLCMPEYRTLEDGSTLWQIKNYMYDQAYSNSSYGYGMAIGVVIFLFSFIMSLIVNRATKREVLQY